MRRYGVRCHIIDTVLDAEQRMVAWWFSKQLGIAEQEDFDVLENSLASCAFQCRQYRARALGGVTHRSAIGDTSRSHTSKCALGRCGFLPVAAMWLAIVAALAALGRSITGGQTAVSVGAG